MAGTIFLKVSTALGIVAYCLVLMASGEAPIAITVMTGAFSLATLCASTALLWRSLLERASATNGPEG